VAATSATIERITFTSEGGRWEVSIGIPIEAQTIEDLADPAVARSPRHLHEELYRTYLG
jgi:hypothetical protein